MLVGNDIRPKPKKPAEPSIPACMGDMPRSSCHNGKSTPIDMKTNTLPMSIDQRLLITIQACGSCFNWSLVSKYYKPNVYFVFQYPNFSSANIVSCMNLSASKSSIVNGLFLFIGDTR